MMPKQGRACRAPHHHPPPLGTIRNSGSQLPTHYAAPLPLRRNVPLTPRPHHQLPTSVPGQDMHPTSRPGSGTTCR